MLLCSRIAAVGNAVNSRKLFQCERGRLTIKSVSVNERSLRFQLGAHDSSSVTSAAHGQKK